MESDEVDHEHCARCYKTYCLDEESGCPMVDCSLHCGQRFHSCKLEEHILICSKEKVPCLNAGNGCPLEMTRSALSHHLPVCPASVIHCTMEWNRWPVYSKERCARVPFSNRNYHAKYGQLDVALALRDQRILNDAMKAPRRTKRALRNKLTQRFPAVPFNRQTSRDALDGSLSPVDSDSKGFTDDDETDSDAPWEASKRPPGLASSVCSELFQTAASAPKSEPNGASESSDEPSAMRSPPERVGSPPLLDGLKHANVHVTQESVQAMAMPKTFNIPQPPPLLLEELLALDLHLESITRYQAKAKSMYTFLCAQCFRRDEYPWHFQNVHCDIQGGLNGWFEQRCPLAHYGCTYSFHRFHPGIREAKVVFSPLLESFGVKVSPPGCSGATDLSEYKEKRSHSKEPTPEILTSVNYNSAVQVNGVVRSSAHAAVDYLTSLPFEILRHIASFLDGFSLCNVALTCRTLRDVCCSLLPERGIVVQEWEKDQKSRKWRITYQVSAL